MQHFISTFQQLGIRTRLVVYYIVFAVATVGAVLYFAYTGATHSLEAAVKDQLKTVAVLKRDSVDQWVDARQRNALALANLPELQILSRRLLAPDSSPQIREMAYRDLMKLLQAAVHYNLDFQDIQIIDTSGRVVFSMLSDLVGTSQAEQPFFLEGRDKTFIQSFYYSDTFDRTLLTIATPLLDNSQKPIGTLVLHCKVERVDRIIYQNPDSMDRSMKTYLVDTDRHLILDRSFPSAKTASLYSSAIDL